MGSPLGRVPGVRTAMGTPTLRLGDGVSRPTTKELTEALERAAAAEMEVVTLTMQVSNQNRMLRFARTALLRHSDWCGYREEAPGDESFNTAREVLDRWWLEQCE
jgi:hypothetical protein